MDTVKEYTIRQAGSKRRTNIRSEFLHKIWLVIIF